MEDEAKAAVVKVSNHELARQVLERLEDWGNHFAKSQNLMRGVSQGYEVHQLKGREEGLRIAASEVYKLMDRIKENDKNEKTG